jgi:hypothetical protein
MIPYFNYTGFTLSIEKETSLNIIIVIIENVFVGYNDERNEMENGSYKTQITENACYEGQSY